jgi:hypothetical protein
LSTDYKNHKRESLRDFTARKRFRRAETPQPTPTTPEQEKPASAPVKPQHVQSFDVIRPLPAASDKTSLPDDFEDVYQRLKELQPIDVEGQLMDGVTISNGSIFLTKHIQMMDEVRTKPSSAIFAATFARCKQAVYRSDQLKRGSETELCGD